ncbi:MAG: hypothetical protein KUG56_00885, partial [Kordiimonadaceae bacterium]|nr:hypothetical protein [Kordiimonadaceae bacterium]
MPKGLLCDGTGAVCYFSLWIDAIIARCAIVQAADAIVIKEGAAVVSSLRLVVFGVPMGILLATVIASIVDLNSLLATTSGMNSWVLSHFSGLFSWG